MSEPVVTMTVNGVDLKFWREVHIKRSMEEAAHSFALRYWDQKDLQNRPLPVQTEDAVEIDIDGTLAITGFIDETGATEDATEYDLTISGRSAAGDLVDCSAIHQTGQWTNSTLLSIASDLLQPFGLTASADPALKASLSTPIPSFTIQDGETVFDAIARAAKFSGVLPVSDPKGNILFTRAGPTRTATQLVRGQNVLKGAHRSNGRERSSSYTVKGQSPGNSHTNGSQASAIIATVQDSGVKRYRPLVLIADFNGATGLMPRATWERNVRAGREHRWTFTVAGWTNAEGLWKPNVICHVLHDRFGLDDDLLILAATLHLDDQGRRTELELGQPAGYDVQGLPPPRRGKRRRHQPRTTVAT